MHPLLDEFERTAAARATRVAASDQSLTLDNRAFRAAAMGLAGHMHAATGRERIGILAPTSTACAAAVFAAWYAGKTPVPLNFLLPPAELAKVVGDAEIDCIATIERFAPLVEGSGSKALLLNAQTMTPGAGHGGSGTVGGHSPPYNETGEVEHRRAGKAELCTTPPGKGWDDTAVILYTSGTSGAPKGVCLSFANVVKNAKNCVAHARMNPDQVFLSVLPQFHSFGLTALTVIPLLLGATVHYLPRFSPVTVINLIQEKQVSVFLAVASMFGALAHVKSASSDALRSLVLAISGGEPLPPTVAAGFKAKFGVELLEGYGLTETSPVVSVNVPWAHRAGSVGRALPEVEVKAVSVAGADALRRAPNEPRPSGSELGGKENARNEPPPSASGLGTTESARNEPRPSGSGTELAAVPPGVDGELYIRGHGVMQGYYKRPADTAAALHDGWFKTGDIGRIDADGFIYITGRAKEMMIIGGENVYPREIESVLEQHPAVAEAAAIGVSDGIRGEIPVAFVILKDGAASARDRAASARDGAAPPALDASSWGGGPVTDAELRDFCRDKIAGFKIPRRIHIAKELPRSATGKILKRALKEP